MPLGKNNLFVGRRDELKELARALREGPAAIGQVATVTGMGGIGKTQLASAFVHRYGQYFEGGVFWLSFAEKESVETEVGLSGGPEGMGLYGKDAAGLADNVALVRSLWKSEMPRLLVFDNCESEALFREWAPKTGGCRVLVTSRRDTWSDDLGVKSIKIEVLGETESIALLKKFRKDIPDKLLLAIADELGFLPLALHVAGSYLKYFGESAQKYLAELSSDSILNHRSLKGEGGRWSPTKHDLDVGRTFAISVERLRADDPVDAVALKLLARIGYLAHGEPIPEYVLFATLGEREDKDALVEKKGLRRLIQVGLVERIETDMVVVHRLVGRYVLDSHGEKEALAGVEAGLLREAKNICNSGIPGPLLVWQVHLKTVTDRASKGDGERGATLCNGLGFHFGMIGEYHKAKPYYEKALAIYQKVLGDLHPHTASSLNNMGSLLQDLGENEAARPYYEKALAIRKKVLGDLNPDTASSLNNMGSLLKAMGETEAARPYYEKALAIYQKVLGDLHPDTASSLNNMGSLLKAMGENEAARPYYEKALAIRKKVLGDLHPDTASSLNNMGYLLKAMGETEAARPYYEKALAIYQKVLGDLHPDTANSLNNMGYLLQAMGETEDARPYYEKALAIRKKVLGDLHPDTAQSLNNMGGLLQAMGENEAARPYLEKALAISVKSLGDQHPNTKIVRGNLESLK